MSLHRDAPTGVRRTLRTGTWPLPNVRAARIVLAVAAGGALAACGVPAEGGHRGELRGSVMDSPIEKPDLVLTDTQGETFDLRKETDGYVTLLFFGYTHCPDVCPVHMANLGAVFGDLLPEVRERVKVVFVTTDPERDTPERIRSWLDTFNPSFIGLRGATDEINEALASMMLPGVAVFPAEQGGEPMIGHPAAVLAFSPDGPARVRYPFGVRQSDWAHDIPLLAEGS